MKKSILLFILALAALAGCLTYSQPIPSSEAKIPPDKRIYDTQFMTPKAGFGTVLVKRDSGSPVACHVNILVDGNLSAELVSGEKVIFYLPEGPHIIGGQLTNSCGGSLMEAEAIVAKNRPLAFRIGYNAGGYFINPTAF
jgi:hypothetical protein